MSGPQQQRSGGDHREAWAARFSAWRAREQELIAPTIVLLTRSLRGLDANAVQSLLAAWPLIQHRWQQPEVPPPPDDGDAWWLSWGRLEDRVPDVMRATGLGEADALRALRVVVTNRMVYPDGSISQGSRSFLTAESATVLRRRVGNPQPAAGGGGGGPAGGRGGR